MGGIGGLFGFGSGVAGTNITGPEQAPIQPGTNPYQVQQSYNGSQNALGGQQALLSALQGQGGIQNQSNLYGQMQGTANQYQNIANGTGPNPAMAQLAQTTGQNVSNQAALMAGQRGSGANVGLMARQAAMQGANTQQQAAGQAATMSAQQQLAGLQGLQSQQGMLAGQANNMVGNQIGAVGANTSAQMGQQQMLQNSLGAYTNAQVNMQNGINSANAGLANTQLQGQQAVIGGAMQGISGSGASMAQGGVVKKFDEGGPTLGASWDAPNQEQNAPNLGVQGVSPAPTPGPSLGANTNLGYSGASAPQSTFAQFLQGTPASSNAAAPAAPQFSADSGAAALEKGMAGMASMGTQAVKGLMSSGGGGDSSGGGSPLSMLPMLAMAANQGGTVGSRLKSGGHVPGKPMVAGNSLKNDNVKALLSPGELVVDRETMNDKGKAGQAARFLAAVIASKKAGKK